MSRLSEQEWLARYGDVHVSERWFEGRDPNWQENPDSWWRKETGRDGGREPLWMQKEVGMMESLLLYPPSPRSLFL